MNILYIYSLLLAMVMLPATSEAKNEGIRQYESYVELVKKKDVDLDGKMRVFGTVQGQYNSTESTSIVIYVNNKALDTLKNGKFDLLFSEGDIIEDISFKDVNHWFYPASTGPVKFKADKSLQYRVVMAVPMIEAEKPVIYLYPEVETQVDLKLNFNGQLNFMYPEYKWDGWSVTAHPNGKITLDNQSYDYLFYDGWMGQEAYNEKEGFVVAGSETVSFFEEKLTQLGFNDSEKNDFITYWAPRMVNNEFNHVQFLVDEDYDQISSLDVTPKPQTIIRLYMYFKPVDADYTVTNMLLPVYKREGFTLVEWGGSEVKKTTKEL